MMCVRVLCSLVLLTCLSTPGFGQRIFEGVEEVDFDAPEAWAMKFFNTASLMTSLGPVHKRDAGAIDLGFEVQQVPYLDREQRTVGFGGRKEEQLNRSPVSARMRVEVGLPRGFNVALGWSPPVEVDGVEANLLSLALEKVLLDRQRWRLGLRAYGQVGDAKGDLTCEEGGDERFPPGSPENRFGCVAPSEDEVTLDHYGVQLVASYHPRGARSPTLHFGTALSFLDMEFQVNARTFGDIDRSRLLTDGETLAFTVGATWQLLERAHLGLEAFYSALDVERRGQERENDPFVNLRALVRYRLR